MPEYQLKIKLLSDMCVSDGGVYNSMIDTDSCYDAYGFPFIPARRIKGCLRECAMELNDWGYMNSKTMQPIPISRIFGNEGREDEAAKVRFGNAYLEDYDRLKNEVQNNKANPIYHRQLILNQYSYIRTQTAISPDTGIADDTSLRTMRVINKGLTFIADVNLSNELYDDLNACCAIFSHMGIARTRGFGEILVTLTDSSKKDKAYDRKENSKSMVLEQGATTIEYEVSLEEPVICKSIAGGEARTQDYIEGSKMIGLVLSEIRKTEGDEKVKSFLENNTLCFSNAYIGRNGKRFTEIPAYIYSIKNNKTDYVNRIINKDMVAGIQLSSAKHCYVSFDGTNMRTADVNIEERYHHRRPADKSIGRAVSSNEGSDFYQMSSISANQNFYGFISGNPDQIAMVYKAMTARDDYYIGTSRTAEYGKVRLRIVRTYKNDEKQITGRDLLVTLNSPVILYNEKAMYSVDKTDLKNELCTVLGLNAQTLCDAFINYTTVGGFNVTWGFRKPTIMAFDKGTALCFHLPREAKITVPARIFIGERTLEGYGEIEVTAINKKSVVKINSEKPIQKLEQGNLEYLDQAVKQISSGHIISEDEATAGTQEIFIESGSLGEQLAETLYLSYLQAKAVKAADSLTDKIEKYRPTVSNMLIDFRGYKNIDQVQKMVNDRYGKTSEKKEEKLSYAQNILKLAINGFNQSKRDFCREFHIAEWDWDRTDIKNTENITERYQLIYLRELLIAIKYRIRNTTVGGEN